MKIGDEPEQTHCHRGAITIATTEVVNSVIQALKYTAPGLSIVRQLPDSYPLLLWQARPQVTATLPLKCRKNRQSVCSYYNDDVGKAIRSPGEEKAV